MAFLTISLCAQLSAIAGDEFGLSRPFRPPPHLRLIAAVCVRSAPQMLHESGGEPPRLVRENQTKRPRPVRLCGLFS